MFVILFFPLYILGFSFERKRKLLIVRQNDEWASQLKVCVRLCGLLSDTIIQVLNMFENFSVLLKLMLDSYSLVLLVEKTVTSLVA